MPMRQYVTQKLGTSPWLAKNRSGLVYGQFLALTLTPNVLAYHLFIVPFLSFSYKIYQHHTLVILSVNIPFRAQSWDHQWFTLQTHIPHQSQDSCCSLHRGTEGWASHLQEVKTIVPKDLCTPWTLQDHAGLDNLNPFSSLFLLLSSFVYLLCSSGHFYF